MQDRFVILQHSGYGQEHYDLMLRRGQALATWQFADPPHGLGAGKTLRCRRLADHRQEYLTYEGLISGSRGSVKRIDEGEFEILTRDDGKWVFKTAGQLLAGCYELAGPEPGKADEWIFKKMSE